MFGPTWWPYSFLTIPATSLAFAVGSLLSTLRMARLLLFLGSERSDDAFLAIHYLEVESKDQHKVSLCRSMVKIAFQSVSVSADLSGLGILPMRHRLEAGGSPCHARGARSDVNER